MAQHDLSLDCLENTLCKAGQPLSGYGQTMQDRQWQEILLLLQRAAKQELTPKQQTCVRLYYGEGLTMEEIALHLDIQKSGVCRHLQKARKRLGQVLRYHFPQRLAG